MRRALLILRRTCTMIASYWMSIIIRFILSVCHIRRLLLRRRIHSLISTIDLVLCKLSIFELLIHWGVADKQHVGIFEIGYLVWVGLLCLCSHWDTVHLSWLLQSLSSNTRPILLNEEVIVISMVMRLLWLDVWISVMIGIGCWHWLNTGILHFTLSNSHSDRNASCSINHRMLTRLEP